MSVPASRKYVPEKSLREKTSKDRILYFMTSAMRCLKGRKGAAERRLAGAGRPLRHRSLAARLSERPMSLVLILAGSTGEDSSQSRASDRSPIADLCHRCRSASARKAIAARASGGVRAERQHLHERRCVDPRLAERSLDFAQALVHDPSSASRSASWSSISPEFKPPAGWALVRRGFGQL